MVPDLTVHQIVWTRYIWFSVYKFCRQEPMCSTLIPISFARGSIIFIGMKDIHLRLLIQSLQHFRHMFQSHVYLFTQRMYLSYLHTYFPEGHVSVLCIPVFLKDVFQSHAYLFTQRTFFSPMRTYFPKGHVWMLWMPIYQNDVFQSHEYLVTQRTFFKSHAYLFTSRTDFSPMHNYIPEWHVSVHVSVLCLPVYPKDVFHSYSYLFSRRTYFSLVHTWRTYFKILRTYFLKRTCLCSVHTIYLFTLRTCFSPIHTCFPKGRV